MTNGNERVRVVIRSQKFIPTVGKGPILSPIHITKQQYDILKVLGFNVEIVGEKELEKKEVPEMPTKPTEEPEVKEEVVEETTPEVEPEPVVEEKVEEEVVTEPVVEEQPVVTEPVEEVTHEEVAEEGEEEITAEDVEKMERKELRDVLDANEVKYAKNATDEKLKELVLALIEA